MRPGGNGAADTGGGGGERAIGGRQLPVYLSASGYGVVKPSVRVPRKMTIKSSSRSVKPRFPLVMSMFSLTSGSGQQVTFSMVPGGQ